MNTQLIGDFIKKKRKEKGLTQKQLADKLNITDRAVSEWERGICCPDISLLKDLTRILEISLNELLSGHEVEKLEITETDNTLFNSVQNYAKLEKKKTKKRVILMILTFILLGIIIYITYNQITKTDKPSWDTIENIIISDKYFNALENYDYNTILKLTLEYDNKIKDEELESICNEYKEQKISGQLQEERPQICLLKELENEKIEFLSHEYMTQYYMGNGNFGVQYEIKIKCKDEITTLYITTIVNNGVISTTGAGYTEDEDYRIFRQKHTFALHKVHLFLLGEDWMDEIY